MLSRKFWSGVALTALSAAANNGVAFAQSTGSQDFEQDTIVVTARRAPAVVGDVMVSETAAKSRASIDQRFIETQSVGQSALQLINLLPGVNFTNNDSFGSSGGNLRMRSFDGNRISLLFDGMPLNDTGNYAIFSNQLLDPELLGSIQVNMGSTDVDSPTASATGGTVNYLLRKPSESLDWAGSIATGEESYKRAFLGIDSGNYGPWNTNFLLAASYQYYQKWRGFGDLQKRQINGRVFQPLGENGDFVAVAFHYNQNRNNNYRSVTKAQYDLDPTFDFDATCAIPTPGAGAQTTPDCTNFFGRQVNPSNTGNIRGSSRFTLSDKFTLTVDPSFQYTLADGGGQFGRVFENAAANLGDTASRVLLANNGGSTDLNFDGDTLDRVGFFTPSVTNTRRFGLTSSLIWQATDTQRFRLAYTFDYGRHRQTGEYTFLNLDGTTTNVFGGKDGEGGVRVYNRDGYHLRGRDRFSIAELNQVSLEYRGEFLEDKLTVSAGLRAPFFKRDLNQYCYTQENSSSVLCTSLTATSVGARAGYVRFDFNKDGDRADTGENINYLAPYSRTQKYDDVLPNLGVSYKLTSETQLYASYVEGLSAPRTDNLYTDFRNPVKPEKTQAYDVGVRYNGRKLQGSFAGFYTAYSDRIQTAFDEATGANIDRSIGDVDVWGLEAAVGANVVENLNAFLTATYLNSELKSDIRQGAGLDGIRGSADDPFLPTKGKQLAETPEWTIGGRVSYELGPVRVGLDGKWVDERFSTDVNDQKTDAYATFDLDINVDFEKLMGWKGVSFQLNGNNIFDEGYLGSISSASNALPIVTKGTTIAAGSPTFQIGAPQTFTMQLRKSF